MLQQIQFNQKMAGSRNTTPLGQMKNRVNFTAIERTLSLTKPDSFQRGIYNYIEDRIVHNTGCKVIAEKTFSPFFNPLPINILEKHYPKYTKESFWNGLVEYLTGGKLTARVLEGEDAVSKVRQETLAIRKELVPAGEKQKNLAHATESANEASGEIENFFPELK